MRWWNPRSPYKVLPISVTKKEEWYLSLLNLHRNPAKYRNNQSQTYSICKSSSRQTQYNNKSIYGSTAILWPYLDFWNFAFGDRRVVTMVKRKHSKVRHSWSLNKAMTVCSKQLVNGVLLWHATANNVMNMLYIHL